MKKNDILRVRVDAVTLTALQRACADSGSSLSHILRESIVHELARRNGKSDAADLNKYGKSIAIAGSDESGACAWLLSSILVGQRPRAGESGERWQRKQRQVWQLLQTLFRALYVPPDSARPTNAHNAILGTELEAIRIESEAIQPSAPISPSSFRDAPTELGFTRVQSI